MINPIIELFNVTDGNGVSLSDYSLVFTDAGAITNTAAFIFGRIIAEPIYILMLTLLAPAVWMVNFITDPSQLTRILVEIGSKISTRAFAIVSPLALGTLGFMFLAFRLLILPRREAAKPAGQKKPSGIRYLGKTGYTFESTVMRGIGKDARKKPVDQLVAALILIIVSVIFTQRPFLVLQKLLDWTQRIIADLTGQTGSVTSPMMSLVRGLTWIINFGGAIPDNCDSAWAAAMQGSSSDALQSCLGSDQAANMTPSFVTALLAALALAIGWIALKFNWGFLKQATWFLAVVVWESILIPYLALRTIFQPNRNNGRGSLDNILAIFRIIITYLCYFIGIVFLASVLPSAIIGALQSINANAIIQVAALGAVYWWFAKYIIPNIKPGGTLLGTTMLGEKAAYDGWGDWRESYWENPNNRPADIFARLGMEQFPGSPQDLRQRRQRAASSGSSTASTAAPSGQNKKGGRVLSEADQRSVDNMREKPSALGAASPARGKPPTPAKLGDGLSAPAAVVGAAATAALANSSPAVSTSKTTTPSPAPVDAVTGGAVRVGAPPPATAGTGLGEAAAPLSDGSRHRRPDAAPTGANTTGSTYETTTNNDNRAYTVASSTYSSTVSTTGNLVPPTTDTTTPAAGPGTTPLDNPWMSLGDRAQQLLRDHQRVTEQVVHVVSDGRPDPREFARDTAALRLNRPAVTSLYDAIRRWRLNGTRIAAGDAPGTPSAAAATVTDTTSPPTDFVAAATADRYHRRLLTDAQARGINLAVENDDQPSPIPSFWHDAREGDIGIRFLRQQGFGDRI